MSRYVNPFTDIGFKIIFGQPASKGLLITLLNELLAGEHHIMDLTFLDKEDHSDNVSERGIIYDLYCRTDSGEYIIVEMQNRWHKNFLDRTLYYICRAISRQVESPSSNEVSIPEGSMMVREALAPYGKQYKLPTIYGVFLMNFKEPDLDAKFRTDTVLADRDTGKVVNPHLRQIYLQFPYFTKELPDCPTLYDKLIYTLKNMSDWNRMPDALKDQVFEHLARLAAVANLSEENRIAYDKALDRYRVNQIVEEEERLKKEEERLRKEEIRRKEKELQSKEEELQSKEEEMRHKEEEIKRKYEEIKYKEEQAKSDTLGIARHLKEIGLDAAAIHKATGLTFEEIQSL